MINHLSVACKKFSFVTSIKKTVILTQGGTSEGTITLNGKQLETARKFRYLGSTIISSLDEELGIRIGKAAAYFGRHSKRAWNSKILTIKTKIRIYEACIMSTFPYGSDTRTLYSGKEKRLNVLHLRCLRKIMGVSWQDKVTNIEVLVRANLPNMTAILRKTRIR